MTEWLAALESSSIYEGTHELPPLVVATKETLRAKSAYLSGIRTQLMQMSRSSSLLRQRTTPADPCTRSFIFLKGKFRRKIGCFLRHISRYMKVLSSALAEKILRTPISAFPDLTVLRAVSGEASSSPLTPDVTVSCWSLVE